MKKLLVMALALVFISYFSVCFAEDQFTITNKSGYPVYIYDWDMSVSPAVKTMPIKGADPLATGKSINLPMQKASNAATAGRRIYVSAEKLANSLEGGGAPNNPPAPPDAFTPWYDGGVIYSFLEYLYEPDNSRYTVDLSYIDEYSYPLTVTFSGNSSYAGYEEHFEYGFTSLSTVETALKKQTKYPWEELVWPKDNPSNPGGANWPSGIYRIIGPNKVWTSDSFGLSGYAPDSYQEFVKTLPYNGNQLFAVKYTNFDGWRYSTTLPASTGYVQALHSAAKPDINGKYGFFCYPEDNATGEFTWVPLDAECTVIIYPYDL